ncbi:hypothetical protein LTR85_001043 [Meristemomyces frigidus]|nr:hypothetical protein LTR85_001043 [Meristemomyces frigidus]
MAPNRGKGKSRGTASGNSAPSSSRRSTRKAKDAVPDVYDDLLAEAAVTDAVGESNRPLKRRRILREVSIPSYEPSAGDKGKKSVRQAPAGGGDQARLGINAAGPTGRGLQTVEVSSDEEDESDFAFEDVDLNQPAATGQASAEEDGIADVSIALDPQIAPARRAQARRKPASFAEKAHRLLVHKAHVLCLLGHCIYVNSWCNNEVVQRELESLVTVKMKDYVNPKTSDSQFVRNRSFMDGLGQACEAFHGRFDVTASGTRRAQWVEEGAQDRTQTDVEPMDRSDFIKAARKLQGSQDTGNQLFCALLRSIGVEARLVCSLQPLPFTSTSAKGNTPLKAVKPTVLAIASDTDPDKSEASADDASIRSSRSIGKIPSVRRRLGQPGFASSAAPSPAPKAKKKAIRTLSYPVHWVEAFNAAQQKWIAVDPVVTGTVNKPSKFEPPSSYEFNQMSYVVAFEADGVAKDVTRRYAKAYNAKTRRQRVEATEGGAQWWRKAMRVFRRRGGALDREQVEDAELAQKEAREGLPSNVQDFKDHPYYALERHIKRHEVLHPRREVGKVNAGTAAKPRMEAVFRRQDVLICRSADKWYRLGREVKAGEQPLKHVVARTVRRPKSPTEDDERGEAVTTTALYAANQTELYIPPPVVRGRIPRNAYGNLDIYTPSMVPAGGAHIRHPLTQQAATVLRIDFADAVTGFQFKGRQGTAVVEGAVVAEKYADAVRAIIEGFEEEKREEVSRQRSLRALRLWKRFLTGLRIAERVSAYGDGDGKEKKKKGKERKERMDEVEGEEARTEGAGGFVLEYAPEVEVPLVTAGRYSISELTGPAKTASRKKKKAPESDGEDEYGGMVEGVGDEEVEDRGMLERPDDEYMGGDDGECGGGFIMDAEAEGEKGGGGGFLLVDDDGGSGFLHGEASHEDEGGGGFAVQSDDGGGGFVVEDEEADDGGGILPDAGSAVDGRDDVHGHGGVEAEQLPLHAGEDSGLEHAMVANGFHAPAVDLPSRGATASPQDEDGDTYQDTYATQGELAMMDLPEENLLQAGGDDGRPPEDTIVRAANGSTATDSVPAGKEVDVDVDVEAAGDESDRGSLLSQDPDDEDAEPDWLESD